MDFIIMYSICQCEECKSGKYNPLDYIVKDEDIKKLDEERPLGISGHLRVKNEEMSIAQSIDSCIDALDELIIVYNDCTDDSVEFINHKKEEYPDKIKVYEYKPKIYSVNLNKDEYDYAKKLPQDSEHLLANYYNFALSKISYLYALKIDADQIYFTEELKILCDIYRSSKKYFSWKVLPGMIIWLYFKVMKIIGNKLNIVLPIYPYKIGHYMFNLYTSFVKYAITHYDAQVSLSGLNVYCNTQNWYVTIGKCTKYINILPPYNGTGDHLIFKATDNTFYVPFDSESYNLQRSEKFTIIEHFQGDKFPLPIGVF